jgi:hypothetical protein
MQVLLYSNLQEVTGCGGYVASSHPGHAELYSCKLFVGIIPSFCFLNLPLCFPSLSLHFKFGDRVLVGEVVRESAGEQRE